MIKHSLKNLIRPMWAWLRNSLIDNSLPSASSLFRHSYRTIIFSQLFCDGTSQDQQTDG